MSFFDDGEDTPRPSPRASRPPQRLSPRSPERPGGALPIDQHTLMVRRRVAAGVGVALLIVIVLLVNGCLKSQRTQALKDYNHNVSTLGRESEQKVSSPLFTALSGAGGKSALDVEQQVDELRVQAQNQASRAKGLSTPGAMSGAQSNLVQTFNLRSEGLTKVAALLPAALGGNGKQATTLIAGDMEIFLASDVLYSQRVVPLIQQTLASNGIHGLATSPSRFLPNLGWLDPTIAYTRITGQPAGSAQSGQTVTGNHGSALKGVSVGTNTLEGENALNHISGGSSPTFTVQVENSGEATEANVKVNVTVTAAGKQFKASHVIEKTEPGKTVSVDIPVSGIPLGVAAKIEANIDAVPGENDLENNKGTFLAIFSQ